MTQSDRHSPTQEERIRNTLSQPRLSQTEIYGNRKGKEKHTKTHRGQRDQNM